MLEAHKTVQNARRLIAHAAILAFMLEAGLNRQRLEFAANDLKASCDKLIAELAVVPMNTNLVGLVVCMM